ncbi:MAG: Oxidoreductase domain protein [Parcubacteria group bacterium GW2011_GWA1_36_12]|nr:MAG: Oxidoreductase domain protein [Parcubacteria group bacterium GW2011_GWA1_36_12]
MKNKKIKTPIRIAVLGYGRWGPFIVNNLVRNKGFKVVLVVDKDKKRRDSFRRKFPNIKCSGKIKDSFSNSCDAVAVSLPVKLHFKVVCDALNVGKHVFCEKPLVRTFKEAEILVDLAHKNKKVLFTDYTLIYSREAKYFKKVLNSKKEKVQIVDIRRLSYGIFRKDVDVIYDLAPHDTALLLYWFGLPKKVFAVGKTHINKKILDDVFLVIVYEDGLIAQIHVSWLYPKKIRDIIIVTNNKMLTYDDLKTINKIEIIKKTEGLGGTLKPGFPSTLNNSIYKYTNNKIYRPNIPRNEPLSEACSQFLSRIIKGRYADGEMDLAVSKILEAYEESLRKKSFINIY